MASGKVLQVSRNNTRKQKNKVPTQQTESEKPDPTSKIWALFRNL